MVERRRAIHVRTLMANADEGLAVVGADGKFRLFNETAERLFGVSRGRALGQAVSKLGHEELTAAVARARAGDHEGEHVPVMLDAGGRVLSCKVLGFTHEGAPACAIVVRDDTELTECQERAEAILDGASDGIVVFAPDSRVAYANPAAVEMLGSRASSLVGRQVSLDELLGTHACDGEECACDLPDAMARSESREVIVDGEEQRVLAVRANPVRDREGGVIGRVVSLHDITAERRVALMKNEFVSTVSHELRTPLTSIKGYVDLILDGEAGDINDIQREFLSIVQENSDRLVSLINDLLDISRIESGRIHLRVEPLDVADIVEGAAETFRAVAEHAGVSISTKVARGLPRAAGDRDRIGQVLLNLTSNAIKYSPGGGTVTISARRRGGFVEIAVADPGIGISREDQTRLFEKFYRVDSSLTREIGGTGLGLSICKTIVELLGGGIWARSAPGKGSTFTFSLPVAPPEMVRTPGVEGPLATPGGTVLVVDHDPDIAGLVATFLRKKGYEVITAHSAAEALSLAASQQPRLITLDVLLDDMDGFDLLQHLKDDPRTAGIPIVVLSIVCDEGRSLRLGAAEYLEKPIDQERLLGIVGDLVGGVASPLVLVVDDDRAIVDALCRTLKSRGFATARAYDGREAMAAIGRRRPDLVLLDLRMPVMDGYQVIQEVKSREATMDIPIVIMTGHRIDRDKTDIVSLAAEHLSKPFSPEQLVERVEALLDREG